MGTYVLLRRHLLTEILFLDIDFVLRKCLNINGLLVECYDIFGSLGIDTSVLQ